MNKFEIISNEYNKRIFTLSSSIYREDFAFLEQEFQNHNLVLIGLRQVGKTTLAEQLGYSYYQRHIKNNHEASEKLQKVSPSSKDIFYINIKALSDVSSEELLVHISSNKFKLIIIDEIQEIKTWSNFAQAAIDLLPSSKFIFTGSNAAALSKETIFNRAKIYYIDPLSFKEFKMFWDHDFTILDYLKYGSFPKSKQYDSPSIQYFQMVEERIIDKIINQDFKGVNKAKFEGLMGKMNNFIGNDFKLSKIEDDSITRQTASTYLSIMEQSRFAKTIYRYNDKSDKMIGKVYFIDKSMMYKLNNFEDLNGNLFGSLIENTVFCYLNSHFNKKFGVEDVFVYKNDGKEIDFVVKSINTLIEVKHASILNWEELTAEYNKVVSEQEKDFRKIMITIDQNREVNGWKLITFKSLLEGGINVLL